jgi:hypothetical protein
MADDPQTDDPTTEPPAPTESAEDVARDLEEDPARNPDDEGLKGLKGG